MSPSTDAHIADSDGLASVAFTQDRLTPGPVAAGVVAPVTTVTLSVWTRALHSCREVWRPVASVVRRKQAHVLRRKPADLGQSLTELVVPVRIRFSDGATELSTSMLVDLGSEVLALAPESFFQGRQLVSARRPLRITVANGERIKGGTHGAVVDLGVQIHDCQGQLVQVVCEQVFVYKADVHEHLIVGYPFCKAYGLMVDPVLDLLMDALCGPAGGAGSDCSCTSIHCACRAVAVHRHKRNRPKSYVARLINLASDSDDETSLSSVNVACVHGTALASAAAICATCLLSAITAAAAVSCSAALLCLNAGGAPSRTSPTQRGGEQFETRDHRCTVCVGGCMCRHQHATGLPDPKLVRQRNSSEESDDASEQCVSDEETDSELPPTIVKPLSSGPPPDSFAAGWGYSRPYSGPWQAQSEDLQWRQEPEQALQTRALSLRHFCDCEVDELCGHCGPVQLPAAGDAVNKVPDPLSDGAVKPTSLLSDMMRARFAEQCAASTRLTPMQRRIKLRKRVRQHASYMFAAGRQMLLPGVRDKVLGWAGLQDSKFIDAFATKDTALFSKYWDAKADALVQDWSYPSPGKGDHTDYFLWLHPPHYLLQQTVDKILLDQARGIMLIPVQKNHSW